MFAKIKSTGKIHMLHNHVIEQKICTRRRLYVFKNSKQDIMGKLNKSKQTGNLNFTMITFECN